MNQNSISRYENGEREADYETLIKFADYFNVSLDYLINGDEVILNSHEKELIEAYRKNTEMQGAIDKLLGLN